MPTADVLVVDDNSPDGTAALVEEAAAELGQIKLLRRPGKQGLGSAYRQGFAVALDEGYDVIVSMDVDFSHDPAVIPELLRARRRRRRRRDRLALRARRRHRRLAAAPPAAVALGQPLHVARARPAGPRLHVGLPRLPGRRRWRAIDPGTTTAEGYAFLTELVRRLVRRRPAGDGDPDRVRRPPLRHVEDVGPDRRRVDAARHPLGPPRRRSPARRGAGCATPLAPRGEYRTMHTRARTPSRHPIFLPSAYVRPA